MVWKKQAKKAELWRLTPLMQAQGKQRKQAVVCEFNTSQGYTKEPGLEKNHQTKVSDFEAFRIFR